MVIDSLRREGVDTIYVLPGDPVGDIVNGWADAGHKAIAVRHEQAACMAAQAHSYLTRSVGVCIAASGVGQTNTDRNSQRLRQLLAAVGHRRLV